MNRLNDLNEKYYELYGRLFYYRDCVSKKQYEVMSAALLRAYEGELKQVEDEFELETSVAKYLLKLRLANEKPRRRGLFRLFKLNRYAEALRKNYYKQFEETLKELELKTSGSDVATATSPAKGETLPAVKPESGLEPKSK